MRPSINDVSSEGEGGGGKNTNLGPSLGLKLEQKGETLFMDLILPFAR